MQDSGFLEALKRGISEGCLARLHQGTIDKGGHTALALDGPVSHTGLPCQAATHLARLHQGIIDKGGHAALALDGSVSHTRLPCQAATHLARLHQGIIDSGGCDPPALFQGGDAGQLIDSTACNEREAEQ
eukprot:scaffold95837_cov19-Tisochrysis_lutea.AAC.2